MNTRTRMVLLVVWAVLLSIACWTLHTRHNDFPFFRHPDEPGKVEQLLKREWNFHHPMLLLSVTDLVVKILRIPRNEQDVVEVGRCVSAAFTTLAVVAFSLLGYCWRGWAGALITGVVLSLHHQLYELSHYMKEDSALLMGIAFTLLAAVWFSRRPSVARAALLGAACALAISGKYVGIGMLAVAAAVLWHGKAANRVRTFATFLLASISVFAVVNLPLLTDIAMFRRSLAREVDFVVHGQRDTTRDIPHAQYWNVFLDNTTPAIWLLLLLFLAARWREHRRLTAAEWAVIAFPFVYAAALSFSPKSNDRYFLPATAVFTFLAVAGIQDASFHFHRLSTKNLVAALLALLLVGLQITGWSRSRPGLWQYDRAFQSDDRRELITWTKTELAPDAVLASDNHVGLPDARKEKYLERVPPIQQRVMGERFVADLGTLDQLRARGVTHVLVSESDYGRFFLKSLRPQKGKEVDFQRRKAFYSALFQEGTRLWFRPRGTVIYLHPGIEVYRIQQ